LEAGLFAFAIAGRLRSSTVPQAQPAAGYNFASYAKDVKAACAARVGYLAPVRVNQRHWIGILDASF